MDGYCCEGCYLSAGKRCSGSGGERVVSGLPFGDDENGVVVVRLVVRGRGGLSVWRGFVSSYRVNPLRVSFSVGGWVGDDEIWVLLVG